MIPTREQIEADRVIPLRRYQEEGYSNRYDYLVDLHDDLEKVFALAGLLGGREDFDGLIWMLEEL